MRVWLLFFPFFWSKRKFRNLIITLQLQGRKSPLSPQSILRQLSCVLLHYVAFAYPKANNMQSSGKKKKWHFAGRDEKVNEFKNIVKILALKALNQTFLFKNDCTVLLFCEYLAPWFQQSVISCASKIFAPSDTFYYEIGLLNSQERYSRLSCWGFLQLALIT